MKTVIAVLVLVCASLNSSGDELEARAIQRISDAKSQVGKYPSNLGPFLKSPCVVKELQRILGKDFKDYYHRFLGTCATFQIEQKGHIVSVLKGQTGVGFGWWSTLFFDVKKERVHLVWIKSSIEEGEIKVYGDRPLPENVRSSIISEMEGWNAAFVGDELRIPLKSKMKDPVTKEVFQEGYRFNLPSRSGHPPKAGRERQESDRPLGEIGELDRPTNPGTVQPGDGRQ